MIQSMWADRMEDLQRLWKWFLALGIALVLLGMIALGASVFVTLASVLFFGILFIISGIFQAVHAFQTRQSKGFFLHLLAGVLDLVVGLLLVTHPAVGALTLTLLLAAFFLVGGLFRTVAALSMRFPNWGWTGPGRHRQPPPRHPPMDGMAGIRSLVHRDVHRHRHDLSRLGVDHAGVGCACRPTHGSFGGASRAQASRRTC